MAKQEEVNRGLALYCSRDCADKSKIGKKRPLHSVLMKKKSILGKLWKTDREKMMKMARENGRKVGRAQKGKRKISEAQKMVLRRINSRPESRGKINCLICGKEVEHYKLYPRKFCSFACAYKGRIHRMTEKGRQTLSDKGVKEMYRRLKKNGSFYSRSNQGKRKDLNDTFFRSSWEANVARYFNFVGIKWEFESKTFWFENIKRGNRSYTPDFYLPEEDRYVEVKGWMDKSSKTKLKRMAKYYPNIKIEIIAKDEYKAIAKWKRLIPNWEESIRRR